MCIQFCMKRLCLLSKLSPAASADPYVTVSQVPSMPGHSQLPRSIPYLQSKRKRLAWGQHQRPTVSFPGRTGSHGGSVSPPKYNSNRVVNPHKPMRIQGVPYPRRHTSAHWTSADCVDTLQQSYVVAQPLPRMNVSASPRLFAVQRPGLELGDNGQAPQAAIELGQTPVQFTWPSTGFRVVRQRTTGLPTAYAPGPVEPE
ncbi:hypothetical protein DFH07DRAFT_781045 [Mycena maculata]|uniref:Uncharacterized protein n=1 Tax=Mycena maculata TaxID=230809 RepID=A0AAD7HZV4_9AGAR|nr:hypothetical protein DFH07DRAFT_781045 [Mycena maculata]